MMGTTNASPRDAQNVAPWVQVSIYLPRTHERSYFKDITQKVGTSQCHRGTKAYGNTHAL